MNEAIVQCRYLLRWIEPMLAGLEDSHMAIEPFAGSKTAGWILGHLCVTGDFGRKLCGRKASVPAEWRGPFRPGTEASRDPITYPHAADLCRTLREVYTDLCSAAAEVSETALAAENPFAPAREHFPTNRDFIPWLMSGHFAYHIAQLGDWRRAAGLGHKGWI
jgi:hypothetical protein